MTHRLAGKQHKALLYVMQDGKCAVCGCDLPHFEADHIVPWSVGGETETGNLQLLCTQCHKDKTRSFLAKANKNSSSSSSN